MTDPAKSRRGDPAPPRLRRTREAKSRRETASDRHSALGTEAALEGRASSPETSPEATPSAVEGRDPKVGVVVALSVSAEKGVPKTPVPSVRLVEDFGIEGDAHAGKWHRQVSFLALESIAKMRAKGADVGPGAFAENITTQRIDVPNLRVGDRVRVGEAELEITQIGKECHSRCAIFELVGDCVMPREGVFARVLRGGRISVGDAIEVTAAAGD